MKETPPSSPATYYFLAEASYVEGKAKCQAYLDQHFGSGVMKVHEQERLQETYGRGSTLVTLVENKETGELSFLVEGTTVAQGTFEKVRQIVMAGGSHHMKIPADLLKLVDKKADDWAKKYGNITSIIGHSEGGLIATYMKQSWDCFRITFNGHRCRRGPKNINLYSPKDFVARKTSERSRYIKVRDAKEGHKLKSFWPALQNKQWHEISSKKFKTPQSVEQNLTEQAPATETLDQSSPPPTLKERLLEGETTIVNVGDQDCNLWCSEKINGQYFALMQPISGDQRPIVNSESHQDIETAVSQVTKRMGETLGVQNAKLQIPATIRTLETKEQIKSANEFKILAEASQELSTAMCAQPGVRNITLDNGTTLQMCCSTLQNALQPLCTIYLKGQSGALEVAVDALPPGMTREVMKAVQTLHANAPLHWRIPTLADTISASAQESLKQASLAMLSTV